ncbi:PorT family protein [Parabacteroides sp. 52]|uniref:porin family protein n=1 Tax=unclassified Parabacteroides TaxID=2649774 RepID=UPI0013D3A2CF|nr:MULTISPECIES: porin family protein [unclassified Parabacteroides]MDH6534215.1 hypothetical protein [Parabacteroides sp. PM5-20]NDV55400.1 PorT family protein [Parabacteroides sp. 52]
MAKGIYLFMACTLLSLPLKAQHVHSAREREGKVFNMGATIGFNATFPVINSLSVDDVEVENIHIKYKVGHFASFFCRINMDRFFLQPNIFWHLSESEIHFNTPLNELPETLSNGKGEAPTTQIALQNSSLQVPIFVGYHIVRSGPYGLTFMAGPNFKYNYKESYTFLSTPTNYEYLSDNTPWGLGISTGISVQIRQLFFDFKYEFGLNQVETDFKSKTPAIPAISNNIKIDKRTNVMSFSLGLVF